MAKLFHREIKLPPVVESLYNKEFTFTFTNHAKQACRSDRYGFIIPPVSAQVTKENVIEVEVENEKIIKVLIRIPYAKNPQNDLLVAFIPEQDKGVVKTLWLNRATDKHFTLDKSKYEN